jgi:hypothetical protein
MTQTVFTAGNPITSRLALGVTPDGTTNASVVVRRPDGSTVSTTAPSPWVGDQKTVQWYATDTGLAGGTTAATAGDWIAVWTVTGTGATTAAKVYSVAPLAGTSTRPDWSPFLSEVADFVPYLSVDAISPGTQIYLGTFTGSTSPTDEQAQRHIDAAVAFVGAGFATLTPALARMARAVAATRAAATLARAFARNAADLDLASALDRQAAADLAVLGGAVENAGSTALSAVPVLYAPEPVGWGDLML